MSRVLTSREQQALQELSSHHQEFLVAGHLPDGIGTEALDALVALGLAEKGPSQRYGGELGWRITADGWRCMYGRSIDEIVAGDKTIFPLPIWRWPPQR